MKKTILGCSLLIGGILGYAGTAVATKIGNYNIIRSISDVTLLKFFLVVAFAGFVLALVSLFTKD